MIESLINHRDEIDVLAKLAGIAAVTGLFFAFCQYRHSVKVAARAERRAAVELAARECTHFGIQLLRDIDALHDQIRDSKCEYLNHCKLIKSEKGLQVDASGTTPEDLENIGPHKKKIFEVLNSVEGFAIPFAEGVADDRVGFVECGRLFVQTVERNASLYYFVNLRDYYRSSQDLYMHWRKQIEQEEERRKDIQAATEFLVMGANLVKGRLKSRFWQAVADYALKRLNSK